MRAVALGAQTACLTLGTGNLAPQVRNPLERALDCPNDAVEHAQHLVFQSGEEADNTVDGVLGGAGQCVEHLLTGLFHAVEIQREHAQQQLEIAAQKVGHRLERLTYRVPSVDAPLLQAGTDTGKPPHEGVPLVRYPLRRRRSSGLHAVPVHHQQRDYRDNRQNHGNDRQKSEIHRALRDCHDGSHGAVRGHGRVQRDDNRRNRRYDTDKRHQPRGVLLHPSGELGKFRRHLCENRQQCLAKSGLGVLERRRHALLLAL